MIVIEAATAVFIPSSDNDRRNFFEYRSGHPESPGRLLTAEKLDVFSYDHPVILQVGDSSGFHGVQPPLVESRVGARYLNMSVFGDQGYEGYYQVAKYMFERNPSIRYLVLYITPAGQQPRPSTVSSKDLFGDDLGREYNSFFHSLFRLPTLSLRRVVTDFVYYGSSDPRLHAWLRQPTRYMESALLMQQSGGWTREQDNKILECMQTRDAGDCIDLRESILSWGRRILRKPDESDGKIVDEIGQVFGVSPNVFDPMRLGFVNMADQVYDRFRTLAEAHGAKLIISAAPLSDVFEAGETGKRIQAFTQTLHDYAHTHQTVSAIDTVFWPDERFSSAVHVSTPFIAENTRRFADELAKVVAFDDRMSAADLVAGRAVASEIDLAADYPPAYGLGPAVLSDDGAHRAIRDGRFEAIVFGRAPQQSAYASIELAPGTPPGLLAAVSLTINGEPADRTASDASVLRWRLPPAAQRYGGWMEILISTRGRETWSGDALITGATGPLLKMSRMRFY